jgi:hypothetical protein
MDFTETTFADSREVVDGNKYSHCRFDRCQIVYCGGELPHIVGCTFDACVWHFEDAAQRTLQFMNQLYHGTGDEGRKLIEETLELVRQPTQ